MNTLLIECIFVCTKCYSINVSEYVLSHLCLRLFYLACVKCQSTQHSDEDFDQTNLYFTVEEAGIAPSSQHREIFAFSTVESGLRTNQCVAIAVLLLCRCSKSRLSNLTSVDFFYLLTRRYCRHLTLMKCQKFLCKKVQTNKS